MGQTSRREWHSAKICRAIQRFCAFIVMCASCTNKCVCVWIVTWFIQYNVSFSFCELDGSWWRTIDQYASVTFMWPWSLNPWPWKPNWLVAQLYEIFVYVLVHIPSVVWSCWVYKISVATAGFEQVLFVLSAINVMWTCCWLIVISVNTSIHSGDVVVKMDSQTDAQTCTQWDACPENLMLNVCGVSWKRKLISNSNHILRVVYAVFRSLLCDSSVHFVSSQRLH